MRVVDANVRSKESYAGAAATSLSRAPTNRFPITLFLFCLNNLFHSPYTFGPSPRKSFFDISVVCLE